MLLADIVARLGGELRGDGAIDIVQVAPLERAGGQEIGFVAQAKYRSALQTTQAGAVIVPPALAAECRVACIVTPEPHVYFARLAQCLNPLALGAAGVHPQAVVLSALPASVSVAPLAYVGEDCEIGENVHIGPGCVVERGVRIGAGSVLRANVTVYEDCVLGARCIVHAGTVIGSDGFGYARHRDGRWEKVPQIGRVIIGDDVEIGANTCIDRGALDDTVIADGVKLDNLIQVAHNCRIEEHSALASQVGMAGSSSLGKRVMVGGQAGINGHIHIGDDVVVSGATSMTKDTDRPGLYTSTWAATPHKEWLRDVARFHQLDTLAQRLREMEKKLQELESKK